MIVVSVHLHSARTGEVTELARMEICNDDTGTLQRRNYIARVLRGRSKDVLDRRTTQKTTDIRGWPSEAVHVWNLVAALLAKMGYGSKVHG